MIEKYFKLGIRFRWTKPQDVTVAMDGKIVNSTRPASPLIYDGLDGEVVDPMLKMINVSTLGLTMRMPIQHAWLDYAHGQIARLPIGPYDVLTGFMSGCIIARWIDKGVTYVGHVGTVTGRPAENRLVKRTFAFAMPQTTTGFNPAAAWDLGEILAVINRFRKRPTADIIALVTTRGEFYSIAMLNFGGDQWGVGGIKKVNPIGHDALKLFMLRDD